MYIIIIISKGKREKNKQNKNRENQNKQKQQNTWKKRNPKMGEDANKHSSAKQLVPVPGKPYGFYGR